MCMQNHNNWKIDDFDRYRYLENTKTNKEKKAFKNKNSGYFLRCYRLFFNLRLFTYNQLYGKDKKCFCKQ